jgi:hypothetical protein
MIVQSMTAFLLSALLHAGGDYAIHRTFEKSGPTFQFFLLQPAAILIEEIAIRSARWVSSSTRIRIPELVWRGVGQVVKTIPIHSHPSSSPSPEPHS